MEVGEQVVKLLIVEGVSESGHHVASAEDDGGDAVVVGGCAAGEIFLFVESLQAGSVERAVGIGVVAAGAVRGVDLVSGGFLRSEFAEGLGGRQRRAAAGEERSQECTENQFAQAVQYSIISDRHSLSGR